MLLRQTNQAGKSQGLRPLFLQLRQFLYVQHRLRPAWQMPLRHESEKSRLRLPSLHGLALYPSSGQRLFSMSLRASP